MQTAMGLRLSSTSSILPQMDILETEYVVVDTEKWFGQWTVQSNLWHKPGAITNRPQTTSFNHLFRWEHDIADNGMTGQMWKMPTVTWLRVSWHLSNTFPRSNSRGSQDISREELMNLPFHSSLTRATFWSLDAPSKDRDETRFWARWWWWWRNL